MLSPVFGGEELDGDSEDMGRERDENQRERDKMLRREEKKILGRGRRRELRLLRRKVGR